MVSHNMKSDPMTVNTIYSGRPHTYGQAVEPFLQAGWPAEALLPGIPLGAALTQGSHVNPASIGKVPGTYYRGSGSWSGLAGRWATEGLAGANGGELSQELVQRWPTPQVCVLGRDMLGLDLDIAEAELCEVFHNLAEEVMGFSLPHARVRQGTARRLLPFCAIIGNVGRWQVRFSLPGHDEPCIVEMIGYGYQWLAAGEHKSGNGYEWPIGVPQIGQLGLMTEDLSQKLRAAVLRKVGELGGVVGGGTKLQITAGRERVQTDDLEPLLSLKTLAKVLEAVPASPETIGGHLDALSVVASMRFMLGRLGRTAPDFVEAWAMQYPGTADTWLADRWRSFDGGVDVTEGAFLIWLERVAEDASLVEMVKREIGLSKARAAFPDWVEGEVLGPEEMASADDVEPDERLRGVIDAACRSFVYFEPENRWVCTDNRLEYSRIAFDDSEVGLQVTAADFAVRFAQWNGRGRAPVERSAHKILLPYIYARNCVVKARTYAFGEGPLAYLSITGPTLPYLNKALPSFLQPWPGKVTDADVEPFLTHARQLLPKDDEREVILDWMAWVIQNPTGKIRWAPVLKGPQGHGKDTLFSVLREAVGPFNFEEISPGKLAQKFTGFYERRIALVSEMSNNERHDVYERIKSAITGSSAGMLWVERKGIDPYPTLDRLAWVILTNHDDAIALAQDDRRFYVAETREGKAPPPAYFDALYDWLIVHDGYRKAIAWLQQREVRIFAHSAPGATQAKLDMIEASMPAFARWFLEQLTDDEGAWSKRTIVSLGEVQAWVDANSHLMPAKIYNRYHPKQVREALLAAGWHDTAARVNVGRRGKLRRMHRVFVSTEELLAAPPDALKARFLAEYEHGRSKSPFDVHEGTAAEGV